MTHIKLRKSTETSKKDAAKVEKSFTSVLFLTQKRSGSPVVKWRLNKDHSKFLTRVRKVVVSISALFLLLL